MNSSVISKLVLYIVISCTTAYVGEFNNTTLHDLQMLDPLQWVTKIIGILLPGLITWRAFIDQSITTSGNIIDDKSDNL
jgi:hypothetical protein